MELTQELLDDHLLNLYENLEEVRTPDAPKRASFVNEFTIQAKIASFLSLSLYLFPLVVSLILSPASLSHYARRTSSSFRTMSNVLLDRYSHASSSRHPSSMLS